MRRGRSAASREILTVYFSSPFQRESGYSLWLPVGGLNDRVAIDTAERPRVCGRTERGGAVGAAQQQRQHEEFLREHLRSRLRSRTAPGRTRAGEARRFAASAGCVAAGWRSGALGVRRGGRAGAVRARRASRRSAPRAPAVIFSCAGGFTLRRGGFCRSNCFTAGGARLAGRMDAIPLLSRAELFIQRQRVPRSGSPCTPTDSTSVCVRVSRS